MSESKPYSKMTPKASRRDFLKTSGAVIGATVAGNLSIGRSAHAAGGDAIKIGLVGCGGRGSGAAVNAMSAGSDVKLVALADIFEDKVKSRRTMLKKAKPDQVAVDDDHCFTGFDGCKNVIDSDVDVVLIATASMFHPQYLKAAVDAGKHVFVEKPHGIDPPGIRTVLAACKKAEQKKLSVVSGLCWRYDAGMRETMNRVHDGAIGDIVAIQETYMRSPFRLVQRKPEWSEIEYQYRNWYHFNWLSGDDVAQSLVHSMDKGAWVMKDEPPVKVFGLGGRSSCFEPVFGNLFDHHSMVYEYANGVRMFAFGRAQNGCHNEVSDHILGTKGSANLMKNRIKGENKWQYLGPNSNMYDLEHVALFDSIRSGKPINNGTYMARSSMLAVMAEMTCYGGRQITWEEAMNSAYRMGPTEGTFDMAPPVKPNADGTYPAPIPGVTKVS